MVTFVVEFLDNNSNFSVDLNPSADFKVSMSETQIIEVPIPDLEVEIYDGTYIVIPKTTGQVVETAKKYVERNIEVRGIPYYESSNLSGGNTVYIGTEVI